MTHRLLLVASEVLALFSQSRAQCPVPAQPIPSQIGMSATGYCCIPWDPDGPGPQPTGLLVGGDFRFAGQTPADFIALWTGSQWQPVGSGLPAPVYALAIFNGTLLAGGPIVANTPFSGGLAAWDGAAWHAVPATPGFGAAVQAMLVRGNRLVVGGQAGTVNAWDGNTWFYSGVAPFAIRSLAEFQGDLIAGGGGGEYSYVSRWNGSAWTTFGQLDGWWQGSNYVYGLLEFAGDLYAAGSFDHAGAQWAPGLARWDGQAWQPAATEFPGGSAYALTAWNGRIHAVGQFFVSNPFASTTVISSASQGWTAALGAPTSDIARAAAPWNGELAIVGAFRDGPAAASPGAALWDGEIQWQPVGAGLHAASGGQVWAMTSYQRQLIAAGTFTELGGAYTGGIAGWDGETWHPVGAALGLAVSFGAPLISAIAEYNGELIAAGMITSVNDQTATGFAAWNGSSWRIFPPGDGRQQEALGTFVGSLVAGPNPMNPSFGGAARWDGARWVPMSTGLPPGFPAGFVDSYGSLFTFFLSAGVSPVYRWNGASWSFLSSTPFFASNGCWYQTLAVGGDLYLGGNFQTVGGLPFNNIARWDGTAWRALGAGVSAPVDAIRVFRGDVVGAGSFTSPGPGIARWDGASWLTIPDAIGSSQARLAEFNNQLIVARRQAAGSSTYPALMRWDGLARPCYPDCNCSGGSQPLSAADFACFLNKFAAADPYANCDGSTMPPVLNVLDFICFLNRFAAGCS